MRNVGTIRFGGQGPYDLLKYVGKIRFDDKKVHAPPNSIGAGALVLTCD